MNVITTATELNRSIFMTTEQTPTYEDCVICDLSNYFQVQEWTLMLKWYCSYFSSSNFIHASCRQMAISEHIGYWSDNGLASGSNGQYVGGSGVASTYPGQDFLFRENGDGVENQSLNAQTSLVNSTRTTNGNQNTSDTKIFSRCLQILHSDADVCS